MTNYQDDPNINARRQADMRVSGAGQNNTNMWIGGAVALAAVIALVAYAMSDGTTTTANTNRPVATETRTPTADAMTPPATPGPATTTGSGAANPPLNTGRANTDQGNPASGVQTSPLAKPDAQQPGSSAPSINR
jgi:hypothetical protein